VKLAFAALLAVHGLIHLMGFAKGFGLAELPQLTQPISRAMGLVWLLGAILVLAAAGALFAWPRAWWILGALALLVSQACVLSAWKDARFGTAANAVLLVGVALGLLSRGPWSFRAEYEREAARLLAAGGPGAPIEEADLAPLPPAVQRYLRFAGAVGQPRPRAFVGRFRGRIRGGPKDRWMTFTADQVEAFGEPVRLFHMEASLFGVPFEAWHVMRGTAATMRVKVASLVQVVDARGPEMDRSETVTLLNDMCVLAPGSLLDPRIRWEDRGPLAARATFANGPHTVSADLTFDGEGRLVDFRSADRSRASPDGRSFERVPWSTPLARYRAFGPLRIADRGDAVWHPPGGAFSYIEFEIADMTWDPAR